MRISCTSTYVCIITMFSRSSYSYQLIRTGQTQHLDMSFGCMRPFKLCSQDSISLSQQPNMSENQVFHIRMSQLYDTHGMVYGDSYSYGRSTMAAHMLRARAMAKGYTH